MIPGEEWKSGGHIPTPQDIQKYISTGDRLVIQLSESCYPNEVRILGTENEGELVNLSLGWSGQWVHAADIRVLAILPPLPPPVPHHQNVANRAGLTVLSDQELLELGLVRKKKKVKKEKQHE